MGSLIFSFLNWKSATILYLGVNQAHVLQNCFSSNRETTGIVSTDWFANQAVAHSHRSAANGSRVRVQLLLCLPFLLRGCIDLENMSASRMKRVWEPSSRWREQRIIKPSIATGSGRERRSLRRTGRGERHSMSVIGGCSSVASVDIYHQTGDILVIFREINNPGLANVWQYGWIIAILQFCQ